MKKKEYLCSMKQILKTFSVYSIAYFILLMFVLILLYIYPKLELHLLLNSWHTAAGDLFFKYYSTFAEWPLYILALVPLLWKKKEITFFYALCELSSGVVVQILKHMFSSPRPIMEFEHYPNMMLPLVEGVRLHHSNSFPSGHTATYFVFTTCCALLLAYHYVQSAEHNSKRRTQLNVALVALLILAALGGYSRIYLSQHFLSDVCVGSIIGFVTPCMMFYFGGRKILKLEV